MVSYSTPGGQIVPATFQFLAAIHYHGRVAFLPWVPVTLKGLIPKKTDFEPKTLGEHVRKRRLDLGLNQKQAAWLSPLQ